MSALCPVLPERCHPEGASRPRGPKPRVTTSLLLVSIALTAFPLESSAQQPPPGLVEVKEGTRKGFWFGLGLGAGGESNDLAGPGYSDLFYQPTISLRAGGTVGSNLRLGGEVLSWFDEEGDAVASLSSVLFVAQFYPLSSAGLYLNPVVDLVGHSYSGRLGGGYTERLVNFGLGVLFQSGK
jgi:hypothetical protein